MIVPRVQIILQHQLVVIRSMIVYAILAILVLVIPVPPVKWFHVQLALTSMELVTICIVLIVQSIHHRQLAVLILVVVFVMSDMVAQLVDHVRNCYVINVYVMPTIIFRLPLHMKPAGA
jgi:hypothetical protein